MLHNQLGPPYEGELTGNQRLGNCDGIVPQKVDLVGRAIVNRRLQLQTTSNLPLMEAFTMTSLEGSGSE